MKPHEIDEVDTLIRTAFLTAPVTDGSERDMVKRLRSSTGYLPEQELIALDDRIVGHILTTRIVIDSTAGPVNALEVAPLCVASDHRCRGIGTLLMKEALNRGRTAGFPAVFRVGGPRDSARVGVRPVAELGIHNASSIPDDVVLGIELEPGTLDGTDGSVTLV